MKNTNATPPSPENRYALLCVLADASGSMLHKTGDTIGGINGFFKDQREQPGSASATLITFNERPKTVFESWPLRRVPMIDDGRYRAEGNTALLDAMGFAINVMDVQFQRLAVVEQKMVTEARELYPRPDSIIVLVVTDGEENASHHYRRDQIQQMVKQREATGLWHFVYLGASPEAFQEARRMGVHMNSTVHYQDTGIGTQTAYNAASYATRQIRSGAASSATMDWGAPSNEITENWVPPPNDTDKATADTTTD